MKLCFIIAALFAVASCQVPYREVATFKCDPLHEFVDVELGLESAQRRARLVALLGPVHETMLCKFRIFSTEKRDVIFFRLNNVTFQTGSHRCNDASVRIYDVDTTTYEKKDQIEQFCSTTYGVRSVSSSTNAMIIEITAHNSFPIHFDAMVYDLKTPCGFFCPNEDRCLAAGQKCDHFKDCLDGSDERGCIYETKNKNNELADAAITTNVVHANYGIVGSLGDDRSDHLLGAVTKPENDEEISAEDVDERAKTNFDEMDRISYGSSAASSGCDSPRILTGMGGSFTSLNYPCPYGPRLVCNWEISVPPDNMVTLGFNSLFYIEPAPPVAGGNSTDNKPTCSDWLNIYARRNGTDGKEEEILVRSFCGNKAPTPFYVRTNRVRVEFKSDDQVDGYGFRLHWAAVSKQKLDEIQSSPRMTDRPSVGLRSEACTAGSRGQVLTRRTGSFGSPRFKSGNYTHGANCTWIISGHSDQVVVLFFSEFALEPSNDCAFDAVNIYDGQNHVGKYCGKYFIPPIRSRTNKVVVTFTSDNKVEDAGFRLFYHIVDLGELDDLGNRIRTITTTTLEPELTTTTTLGLVLTVKVEQPSSSATPAVVPLFLETTSPRVTNDAVYDDGRIDTANRTRSSPVQPKQQSGRVVGSVSRVSVQKCGRIPGDAWAASFNGACHGSLIHRRWLLATTNCLSVPKQGDSSNTTNNDENDLNFANVVDWVSNKTIGQIQQLSIKTFRFRGEPMASFEPFRFTGMTLIELTKPVDEAQTTPGVVCLDTNDEDDDTPDGSCEFPTAPGLAKRQHHVHTKSKLSNSKCADVLLAAHGVRIPPDRLHMFECFLVQDVDRADEDTLLSRVDQLPIMKKYCEANPSRYRTMFAEMPLKFCKNYEENWQLSGVLVHVLSSNPLACGQMMEGAPTMTGPTETGDISRHQTIAVYVRVSHFFEWIFTVIGNQVTSPTADNTNKLIKTEDL